MIPLIEFNAVVGKTKTKKVTFNALLIWGIAELSNNRCRVKMPDAAFTVDEPYAEARERWQSTVGIPVLDEAFLEKFLKVAKGLNDQKDS